MYLATRPCFVGADVKLLVFPSNPFTLTTIGFSTTCLCCVDPCHRDTKLNVFCAVINNHAIASYMYTSIRFKCIQYNSNYVRAVCQKIKALNNADLLTVAKHSIYDISGAFDQT